MKKLSRSRMESLEIRFNKRQENLKIEIESINVSWKPSLGNGRLSIRHKLKDLKALSDLESRKISALNSQRI